MAEEEYKCEKCDVYFNSEDALKKHLVEEHSSNGKKSKKSKKKKSKKKKSKKKKSKKATKKAKADKKAKKKEEKEEDPIIKEQIKGSSKMWKMVAVVLLGLLVASFYTNGFAFIGGNNSEGEVIGQDAAQEKAVNFINNNLLQGGMTADVENMTEENGLYKLSLNVMGQKIDSYMTKDGKVLFPQGIDLDEADQQAQEAGEQQAQAQEIEKSEVPKVDLYVMSFCPYGTQALDAMAPVAKLLGDEAKIEPHYVIYSDYASRMGASWEDYCFDENETYCSMHGIKELNEDIRQLCVFNEQEDKFWDYVTYVNDKCSVNDIDTCWEKAAEATGVDKSKVESCFDNKGELLLKKEALLNNKYNVQGSPTLLINEGQYSGGRTPEAFKQAICNAFTETPEECDSELSAEGATAEGSC